MTTGSEWQERVGQSWAPEWRRTDRSFANVTPQLVAAAQAHSYHRALDIGCGAGELTVRLAQAAPSARHLGIDISEDLLAVARQRTDGLENASVELADASVWTADDAARPDLLISRHGVMFFPQVTGAFEHLRNQALAGARLAFSCFRKRMDPRAIRDHSIRSGYTRSPRSGSLCTG